MNVLAISKRISRQFRRDQRSLALLIIAPMFILTLLWLVLDVEAYDPAIAVIDAPEPFISALQEEGVSIAEGLSVKEAETALQNQEIDAYLHVDQENSYIILEGSDPTANRAVQHLLQQSLLTLNTQNMDIQMHFLHGSAELNLFDRIGPVLIGLFIFFFIFLLGGVSFLRERTQGTLERLLSTPIKRWQIVVGYLCGFGLFAMLQSIIIVAYCIYVLDMYMAGAFVYVLFVTFLLAVTALSLGTMLSAFAKNEFQMIQFIPIVIVPQVFFSGIFHLETMEPWLGAIGKVMPLTYGAQALQEIMIRGQGFSGFQADVYVLIGFALVFILLNTLALKKHRSL